MSNALAIASVTVVLKDLLNNSLIDHDISSAVGNVRITSLSPNRIDTNATNLQSQLNLFLYHVTPNTGWCNEQLPSHNAQGERISNPPLALNLHYLLTAYGAIELHAEILLGYAMQLLHETPVLTRNAIRRAIAPPTQVSGGGGLPADLQLLFTSELAEQIEQIRIIRETLSTEEISKMWTAFQSPYYPSVAYQISVILIESKLTTKSALPVRSPNLYVIPFNQPVIEQIKSQAQTDAPIIADQPILAGYNLVIVGRQLRGESVVIRMGSIEVAHVDVKDKQIIVPIPASLQPGVQSVQVIHRTMMGTPPEPHIGVESNIAAFILRPRIESVSTSNIQSATGNLLSGDVNLHIKPPVGNTQRVVLLLNEFIPIGQSSPGESYSFIAPPSSILSPPDEPFGARENITIHFNDVKAGKYLARIQVDGAESPLSLDATGQQYASPLVTIQ